MLFHRSTDTISLFDAAWYADACGWTIEIDADRNCAIIWNGYRFLGTARLI